MAWGSSQRPGSTRQSRTMRDRVLREEPTCRAPGCTAPATHDDHIIGWSERQLRGLTVSQWHARSNHQGLCAAHHASKTQLEAARGRARNAAKPKLLGKRTTEPHPGLISPDE